MRIFFAFFKNPPPSSNFIPQNRKEFRKIWTSKNSVVAQNLWEDGSNIWRCGHFFNMGWFNHLNHQVLKNISPKNHPKSSTQKTIQKNLNHPNTETTSTISKTQLSFETSGWSGCDLLGEVALRESSAWSEALDLFGNHVVSGVGRRGGGGNCATTRLFGVWDEMILEG